MRLVWYNNLFGRSRTHENKEKTKHDRRSANTQEHEFVLIFSSPKFNRNCFFVFVFGEIENGNGGNVCTSSRHDIEHGWIAEMNSVGWKLTCVSVNIVRDKNLNSFYFLLLLLNLRRGARVTSRQIMCIFIDWLSNK